MSCRVIDEKQIERHFSSADLEKLYEFTPTSHVKRPTPNVPKDRLMAELVKDFKEWIVAFHEHDSLLENKKDEELNEEERKDAWEEFENVTHDSQPSFTHDSLPSFTHDSQPSFTRSPLVDAPLNSVPTPGVAESAEYERYEPRVEEDFNEWLTNCSLGPMSW